MPSSDDGEGYLGHTIRTLSRRLSRSGVDGEPVDLGSCIGNSRSKVVADTDSHEVLRTCTVFLATFGLVVVSFRVTDS